MAPIYTFTGDTPAILVGLIQGVNAHHVAAPGNPEVPEGTTVVAGPGDSVDTQGLDYPAALLQEEPAAPPVTQKPATAPAAPVTPTPAPDTATAPAADPAAPAPTF